MHYYQKTPGGKKNIKIKIKIQKPSNKFPLNIPTKASQVKKIKLFIKNSQNHKKKNSSPLKFEHSCKTTSCEKHQTHGMVVKRLVQWYHNCKKACTHPFLLFILCTWQKWQSCQVWMFGHWLRSPSIHIARMNIVCLVCTLHKQQVVKFGRLDIGQDLHYGLKRVCISCFT